MARMHVKCFCLLVAVVSLYVLYFWCFTSDVPVPGQLSPLERRGSGGSDHNTRGPGTSSSAAERDGHGNSTRSDAEDRVMPSQAREQQPPPTNWTAAVLRRDQRVMSMAMHMSSKASLVRELFCTHLRSAAVFWPPRLGRISIILDAESAADRRFADQLRAREGALGMALDFKFQPLPEDPGILDLPWRRSQGVGLHRQMWNSYFLDQYVDTPVINWMDSDNMLVTPVIPENVFSGGKLKMFGGDVYIQRNRESYMESTYRAIGRKQVAFFGYFPTYIWRDTITNCRNHILKHLNVSRFEEAFNLIHRPYFNYPANVIITYAFYYEHDRYEWHIELAGRSLNLYNRRAADRGRPVRPSEILPDVNAVIHKPKYGRKPGRPCSPFEQGYCVALRHAGRTSGNPRCDELDVTAAHRQLFMIHSSVRLLPTGWCSGAAGQSACDRIEKWHYSTFAKYYTQGLYDFSPSRIEAVEKVAAEMNVTCPPISKLK